MNVAVKVAGQIHQSNEWGEPHRQVQERLDQRLLQRGPQRRQSRSLNRVGVRRCDQHHSSNCLSQHPGVQTAERLTDHSSDAVPDEDYRPIIELFNDSREIVRH